ncbi:hypothetical protein T8K17_18090 [Thalassobaculum sp. OXR-137]|uniref:hypothetical protein n=1 Tax=Thalassobaculum sp. OXR-137 TaxID=3100173 RepID=UPI002AC98D1A|nr:hypothetical protein [Thalassobaculum sp. OXR-137]WPZ33142.1 hypothetical protein T8K17_18090 [Thalassobaculum sp. OXR-137]
MTMSDAEPPAALYTALSLPVLSIDGRVFNGHTVRWHVIERPRPFDPAPFTEIDDELLADFEANEEYAVELVHNTREVIAESFTAEEVAALRSYLSEAHDTALFASPVAVPLAPFQDGDLRATGRWWADRPRVDGSGHQMIWLHRSYGYSLPFKVIGHTISPPSVVDHASARSGAIEAVSAGMTGLGLS